MDILARPESDSDFGAAFLDNIGKNGSAPIVAPLIKFLDNSQDPQGLRANIRAARPALIADIAYFMCVSHGRHPGVIDHAATKILDDSARDWFVLAINAFVAERSFLNRLTVAAGPCRSRQGQDKITALLTAQAKSFQMLATSDRRGCAAGAAIAFVIDWHYSRPLLEKIALSLGIEAHKTDLPDADACKNLYAQLQNNDAASRAMIFGAEQLLGQQRGLWQIIAARHQEMLHSK